MNGSKFDDAAGLSACQEPQIRFAFGGGIGDLLLERLMQDMEAAKLSGKFQLYYKLRPLIPIPVRQWLQKGRNQSTQVPKDWFIDRAFQTQFETALRENASEKTLPIWPRGAQVCASMTHDVETQEGVANVLRIAELEEKHGFRSAWNFIPYKYKIDSGLIRELKDRGHEIGVHGFNHDGRLFENKRTFARRVGPINDAVKRFGARGFRAPMVHRNLHWQQQLDVDWDASCFDVDPFQAMPGGVGGVWPFICGRFVELPYTLPQDHTLFVSLGITDKSIWVEKYNYLRELSGLAMLITHPDYLDTTAKQAIYEDFLCHLSADHACWKALPSEVSEWWRQRDSALQEEQAGNAEVGAVMSVAEAVGCEATSEQNSGENPAPMLA